MLEKGFDYFRGRFWEAEVDGRALDGRVWGEGLDLLDDFRCAFFAGRGWCPSEEQLLRHHQQHFLDFPEASDTNIGTSLRQLLSNLSANTPGRPCNERNVALKFHLDLNDEGAFFWSFL